MEDLSKEISYLRGYAQGLDISEKSEAGKVISRLLDVIDALVDEVEDLRISIDQMDSYMEDIEQDVDMLIDDVYAKPLEDDGEFGEFKISGGDEDDDDDPFGEDLFDEDDEADGPDFFEIECPNCGEDVLVDFDMIDDDNGIVCPNCKETIELEFDCDCDDEDCGHDHEDQ